MALKCMDLMAACPVIMGARRDDMAMHMAEEEGRDLS